MTHDRAPVSTGREAVTLADGLLETLTLAGIVLDGTGRVLLWGSGAERLFGHVAADVTGRPVTQLLGPGRPRRLAEMWLRQPGGPDWSGGLPVRFADGVLRRAEFRAQWTVGMDGAPHALVIAADTATVRRLETDLALSAAIVDQSPLAIALFDAKIHWLRANPALQKMVGLPADRLIGHRFGEVMRDTDLSSIEGALRHVLDTGEPLLGQIVSARPLADPAHEHVWSVSYYRVAVPGGRTCGVVGSAIDVTEPRNAVAGLAAARSRLALIAEAGASIGTTLDLATTARELAGVTVPRLADLAAVDILEAVLDEAPGPPSAREGPARFRTLAALACDSTQAGCAAYPVGEAGSYDASPIVTGVVRTGKSRLLPRLGPDQLRGIARDDQAAAVLRDTGVTSALIVPLTARGDVLGTLTLCRTRHRSPFDTDDLALATELAARAAISVDNARLYGRERNIALILQRSMRPQLPEGNDLDVALRYLPAISEAGGDWCDVLRLPGGRIGLVVGDVMGKGVHAAAIMGQLRSTIRALARLDLPPDALLGHLEDTVESLGDTTATCVYAICDPVGGYCDIASAGHLPPVLVQPDGAAELVNLPNAVPLGVGGVPFTTHRRDLRDGATIALYTDGLVEERDAPIDTGLRAICELLQDPPVSLEETCDRVLHGLRPTTPTDDVALLLARNHRPR
ncbi:SpoIIE family protein phosphatase [Streptomyces avicenniae]|uniref:SpoIIE family protein phosphatase n=1 Tax=Streptomyces avicenniae TaxID=500153 RepID=UPI00069A7874|nr:SpoIIE family protein phosphatase [Streptomyces avicenniae]